MDNETDLIRDQMAETRTSLSEKLEALQEQVLGTVEGTTRTVTETIEAVQEAVEDTVGTVKESVEDTVDTVKSAFDVSEQMQKHPWLLMGGAVVVGYLGTRFLMGRDYTALPPPSNGSPLPPPPSTTERAASAVSSATSSAGNWLSELAAPMLKQLEGMALGVLTGVAADMVETKAPDAVRGQLKEMVENFASSMGTSPIRGLFTSDQTESSSSSPAMSRCGPAVSPSPGRPGGFRPNSPII